MASYTESQPVFEARITAVGLSDDIKESLISNGVTSHSVLAFISEYNPASASEKPLLDAFEDILKRAATIAEKAAFRRLFHESYATVTKEMSLTVEKNEETTARKLSQPERHDRYQRQLKRLTGISIKGPTEPSDALVDLCCTIFEENRLRWIDWSKCTSKDQELVGDKKDPTFTVSGRSIKMEMKSPDIHADTSSEVLLQYALTRRALALDQANLIDFNVSMAWVERIIKLRMEATPQGYEKPSFKQLMAADVQLFTELADRTRAGVQPNAAGRPLDKILKDCMFLPEVNLLMQPRPVVKMESSLISPPKFSPKGKGSFNGKGKGKGKVKGSSFIKMPQGLGGCWHRTAKGEPICFGFNLGKCSEKVERGRCRRGLHMCAAPRCGAHHPAISCEKNPGKPQS